MHSKLDGLKQRHRRLNRLIDNCRAASRQEEMKQLKRLRLRLRDKIAFASNRPQLSGQNATS